MPVAAANGAEIYYEQRGEGPPMILTPGGLQHGLDVFSDVMDGLAVGHRVIAYDRRYAGKSRSPLVVQTWDQMAGDIIGIMDALGLDKADVGGGATGGAISMRCAARYPDRVRSVFAVNINGGQICTSFLMMHLVQSLEIALRSGLPALIDSYDPHDRYGAFVPIQATYDPEYRRHLEAMSPADYAAVMRDTIAALFEDEFVSIGMTRELLASIRVPALIMHGPGDHMHPKPVADAVYRQIPIAQWADVASFRRREDQADYIKAVLRFLDSLPDGH
jgi:pimeloyl-ACP methyl ester carboxylesterase